MRMLMKFWTKEILKSDLHYHIIKCNTELRWLKPHGIGKELTDQWNKMDNFKTDSSVQKMIEEMSQTNGEGFFI